MQTDEVVAGRFVIERLAGSGGMGSVYRARDRETGAPVALKVLRAQRDRGGARFENEVQVLAGLEHPGVVRYVAHGALEDGAPYLVMEWADGEDLGARLSYASLGVAESVRLARAVAEALAAAHAKGTVHRDLKPSNLMLTGVAEAPVKILDFGIARSGARPSVTLTHTGVLMGTPGYMAPEQARGERDIDARADVFALGALLFECITGRPAFLGEHVMALLAKLLLEDPPRVDELRPDVPAALADLVARMLSKAREKRPANAAAVVVELDRFSALDGERAPVGQPRSSGMTGSEQRLLCVIVAAGEGLPTTYTTAESLSYEVMGEARKRLQEELLPRGARIEPLVFGGLLVTLESAGSVADQAARAARCALGMRRLLPTLPMALVTGRGDTSGRIPVGQIIDRAGKLLMGKVTLGAGVRVDEVTRGLLDLRFEITASEGGLELRGERELGEETRTLLGRPTPCVGRDRELKTLLGLIEECAGERVARAVLVTAPAGTGKSRLRQELVLRTRDLHPDVEIWQGRGDAPSAGSAFSLLGSTLRHVAGVLGGEPLPERQAKLRARVERHVIDKEQARVAAFLGEIAGIPFPDEASPRLHAARQSSAAMAEQLRLAFHDFVAAETSARPVLMVLEDVHWGDLPSLKLIDRALRDLREQPLLVFALARPEVRELFPRLWEERGVQEIRLGELNRRAAESLVRHALGSEVTASQVTALVERAAGNAFYLEELIRAVAERHGEALPETVLAMVEARLLGLEPEARHVLRAASVFGGAFWERGVATLLGGMAGHTQTGDIVASLVERELFQRKGQSRFPGQEEFAFRHALLREGAYAMVAEGDRVVGHKLAAKWLERAGESDPTVLAEHFERGGEPLRAVAFYLRAAQQALRGQDWTAAIDRVERGLRCGAEGEARADLLLLFSQGVAHHGHFARSLALATEAVALVPRGGRLWCLAIASRIFMAAALGEPGPLMKAMATLHGVEPDPDGAGSIACALGLIVSIVLSTGRLTFVEDCLQRMERLGGPLAEEDPLVRAWLDHARAEHAIYHGDAWTALTLHHRAAALRAEAGESHLSVTSRFREGYCHGLLGAYAAGEAILDAVLTSGDAGVIEVNARHTLAELKAQRGALDEALRDASAVVDRMVAAQRQGHLGGLRALLAQIHLRRADLEAAEREALAAIELLAMRPHDLLGALATLTDLRLAQGRGAEALAVAQRGVAVQAALPPMYGFNAYLSLVHAEARGATGDSAGARAALTAGRDALLARSEKIGDPAMRRSFLEAVPEHARLFGRAREWLGEAHR